MPRQVLNNNDLRTQIFSSNPWSWVVYHFGESLKGADPQKLATVRQLYDIGEVELIRRRVHQDFEYIVVRRRRRAAREFEHTFKFAGLV